MDYLLSKLQTGTDRKKKDIKNRVSQKESTKKFYINICFGRFILGHVRVIYVHITYGNPVSVSPRAQRYR